MRFLSYRRAFLSFALAAALLAMMLGHPAATWAQVEVNTCGQTVPAGTVGNLQADLQCSTSAGSGGAVILARRATLAMNGHTISQPPTGLSIGVLCLSRCTVTGPGEIYGGVIAVLGRNVVVSDLNIHDVSAGLLIVRSFADVISLTHLGKVLATNVSVLRTGFIGVYAKNARLNGVTSSENALDGVTAGRLQGTNLTTNDNARGGIFAGRADVDGLTANNNATGGGFWTSRGTLQNATLAGNRFANLQGAGGVVDGDVITYGRLAVQNVTCGYSLRISDSSEYLGTLGVCSGD